VSLRFRLLRTAAGVLAGAACALAQAQAQASAPAGASAASAPRVRTTADIVNEAPPGAWRRAVPR